MSKKISDAFQPKITRNDRFAQMSHQEKVIEEKKKEILLKLEAKQKAGGDAKAAVKTESMKNSADAKKLAGFNVFSNDGSFLDQFRQLKDKKAKNVKNNDFGKSSRWLAPSKTSTPAKDRANKPPRISRFSDKPPLILQAPPLITSQISPNFESKITINTSFVSSPPPPLQATPNCLTSAQIVTGQPLLTLTPPVMLNVPPPPPPSQVAVLSDVSHPPPPLPGVELSQIPPPNPIQIQNIPQPEPINALNIPPPAPIQVASIPTPGTMQLNEIPNPQPLDLLAIPTPGDKIIAIADSYIKNVPPPNKSVLPPPPPPPPTVIPSLMAQPILPPGMGGVNVNCPPPPFVMISGRQIMTPNTSQMPPMNVPPPQRPVGVAPANIRTNIHTVFPPGTADYEAMASLARMVAQCGTSIEEVVKQRKIQEPSHWFLFYKESMAFRQYQQLVEQFKRELLEEELKQQNDDLLYKPDEIYEPEMATADDLDEELIGGKRKRRSRWGDTETNIPAPISMCTPFISGGANQMLSKVTRTDPALVKYALNTFGSANLTEEEWKKAEDHYKINLLYQDMVRKREQLKRLQLAGKNQYDYDSDEEVDGGTWEHKLREKEMMATQLWAQELTRQAEGKHHIGDFLPPEELKRFMEKSTAMKEGRQPNFSDYKEFKIKEDNIGFKMLQKLGWSEGQGLGSSGSGIVEPVNKAANRDHNQGLGLNHSEEDEDEYESYRKRMMLAYRFRPNPLNNPRRPYY